MWKHYDEAGIYIYIYIYMRFVLASHWGLCPTCTQTALARLPRERQKKNEKRKKRRKELTWDGGWGEKSGLAAEDIRGREASVGW